MTLIQVHFPPNTGHTKRTPFSDGSYSLYIMERVYRYHYLTFQKCNNFPLLFLFVCFSKTHPESLLSTYQFSPIDLGFSEIPTKIPENYFVDCDQVILNFLPRDQTSRIINTILRKEESWKTNTAGLHYLLQSYGIQDHSGLAKGQTNGSMEQDRKNLMDPHT